MYSAVVRPAPARRCNSRQTASTWGRSWRPFGVSVTVTARRSTAEVSRVSSPARLRLARIRLIVPGPTQAPHASSVAVQYVADTTVAASVLGGVPTPGVAIRRWAGSPPLTADR